jgi:ferric-dicitrate binding protein FerR (iron transport regulator)
MVFDDARLDSVTTELSRWYGMTFLITDSTLGNRRLTGTFRRGELADAIDILNLSLGVQIRQRADTLVIQ